MRIELGVVDYGICMVRWRSAKPALLAHAATGNATGLERALDDEETAERECDKVYWLSLRQELEKLRHAK
jgi:hypothetical protein